MGLFCVRRYVFYTSLYGNLPVLAGTSFVLSCIAVCFAWHASCLRMGGRRQRGCLRRKQRVHHEAHSSFAGFGPGPGCWKCCAAGYPGGFNRGPDTGFRGVGCGYGQPGWRHGGYGYGHRNGMAGAPGPSPAHRAVMTLLLVGIMAGYENDKSNCLMISFNFCNERKGGRKHWRKWWTIPPVERRR